MLAFKVSVKHYIETHLFTCQNEINSKQPAIDGAGKKKILMLGEEQRIFLNNIVYHVHWVKCKFNFSCSLVFSTFFSFYSIPFLFYHCHCKLLIYLPDYTDEYFLMTFLCFQHISLFSVFFFFFVYFGLCFTLETFTKCLMILWSIFE